MNRLPFFSILLPVLFNIYSCGPALKVHTQADRNADFARYRTFALLKDSIPASVNGENKAMILHAVVNEMAGKGYIQTDDHPDLLINPVGILKKTASVNTNTEYFSYAGPYRSYTWGTGYGVSAYKTLDIEKYKIGSLIIDVVDAKTRQLVWQGIGNSRIDNHAEQPNRQIPRAVNRIMETLPPRKDPSF